MKSIVSPSFTLAYLLKTDLTATKMRSCFVIAAHNGLEPWENSLRTNICFLYALLLMLTAYCAVQGISALSSSMLLCLKLGSLGPNFKK